MNHSKITCFRTDSPARSAGFQYLKSSCGVLYCMDLLSVDMKGRYPFAVDSWTVLSRKERHHFLTHAHSDHTSGIDAFDHRLIYSSETTRRLVLRRFPKLDARFIILEICEAKLIPDDEQPFTVTALDANHCPGALMFLFEGNFGNVLHTGDCRLTEDCLRHGLGKYTAQQRVLDCIFLDCTFGRERLKMPSKKEAFQQVRECILNHPQAPIIYLACDLLGQEELLIDLVAYFRMKIFIDKESLPEYFDDIMIVAPDLVTEDPKSTRFHVCEGFPKLYERAKVKFMHAHKLRQPEPLFIRPSAQWYTYEERLEGAGSGMILDVALKRSIKRNRPLPVPKAAEKDQYGVWHVCYSIHSSRTELERAMEILWPKEVISTTPNCHGSEIMTQRTDLFHVEVTVSDRLSKGSSEDAVSNAGPEKRTATSSGVLSSPTSSKRSKKACSHDVPDVEGFQNPLTNVVPLFGASRHTLPPSPPLSFASTDSLSDEDFFDSLSDMEDFELQSSMKEGSGARLHSTSENLDGALVRAAEVDSGATVVRATEVASALVRTTEVDSPETVITPETLRDSKTASQAVGDELDESKDKEKKVAATVSDDIIISRTNKAGGVAIFKETTKRLYRSLRAPIPSPLPSLLDLYNFS